MSRDGFMGYVNIERNQLYQHNRKLGNGQLTLAIATNCILRIFLQFMSIKLRIYVGLRTTAMRRDNYYHAASQYLRT